MSCCACLSHVATTSYAASAHTSPVANTDCIRTKGQLLQLWQVSRELPDIGPVSQGSCQGHHSSQVRPDPFGAPTEKHSARSALVYACSSLPQRQAWVVCCSSHSPLASGARVLFPTTSSILLDHVFAPNIRKVRSRAIPSVRRGRAPDFKATTAGGWCGDRAAGWLAWRRRAALR